MPILGLFQPAVELRDLPIAITGASSGIGAATALACARAGMPVALGARRVERCEQLAEQIRQAGGRAIAVPVDVIDPASCERLVARTVEAFGSIYSVYANAGYGLEIAVDQMTDAQMRDIFEVNFFGSLNTIRPALPHMKAARRGHVLWCSSCLAKLSIPYYSAYSATKAAQAHLGRAMNIELEPLGIRTSIVCPVSTSSEFFDKVKTETGGKRKLIHRLPHQQQTPEQVAGATVACLRRPRAEVWTSAFTRLGMAIASAFPGIEHPALREMRRRREGQ